jgi:hypothetical protein
VRSTGGRWISTVAAVLAIAVSAPASAGAATFGADLNNAPNSELTCNQGAPPFGIPNANTCMWISGVPGPGFYAPQSGTVTAVHVRVGQATGLMQVVVVRSLYRNTTTPGKPEFACCVIQQYGPTFTPQAGTVATVPTSLTMKEDPTPAPEDTTTIAAGDQLALSVLVPDVPMPAYVDGQGGPGGWYPAPTAETVPAPSTNVVQPNANLFGVYGAHLLMSADFEAGGGGGGAGGGGGGGAPGGGAAPAGGGGGATGKGGPPPVPAITLPQLTIPVNGNTATVPIQCLVVDCTGTLALQNAQLAGLARMARKTKKPKAKKPKIVSYGSASFSLKAGTTGKIKVKLNGAGRKLLKGKKTVKVWANARFTSGGGAPKSVRITLER